MACAGDGGGCKGPVLLAASWRAPRVPEELVAASGCDQTVRPTFLQVVDEVDELGSTADLGVSAFQTALSDVDGCCEEAVPLAAAAPADAAESPMPAIEHVQALPTDQERDELGSSLRGMEGPDRHGAAADRVWRQRAPAGS